MSAAPQAFLRARRPTDALPRGFRIPVGGYRVADSRRIDSFSDWRGRPARLYLVRVAGRQEPYSMCLELVTRSAAGGTCFAQSVSRSLATTGRVIAVEASLFGGVASNNVERVVVVSAGGTRVKVHLTRDKGFIYECGDARGCASTRAVRAVYAYGSDGRLLSQQSWR
jgi:hypothetical protein